MKNMDKKTKIIIAVAAIFIVVATIFMFGGGIKTPTSSDTSDRATMPKATSTTSEITSGTVVEQDFKCSNSSFSKIAIVFNKLYDYEGSGIVVQLLKDNKVYSETYVDTVDISDQHRVYFNVYPEVNNANKSTFTIKIYSKNGIDSGVALMLSDKINTHFTFNNESIDGSICFNVE